MDCILLSPADSNASALLWFLFLIISSSLTSCSFQMLASNPQSWRLHETQLFWHLLSSSAALQVHGFHFLLLLHITAFVSKFGLKWLRATTCLAKIEWQRLRRQLVWCLVLRKELGHVLAKFADARLTSLEELLLLCCFLCRLTPSLRSLSFLALRLLLYFQVWVEQHNYFSSKSQLQWYS